MLASDWLTGSLGLSAYFGMSRIKLTKRDFMDAYHAEKIIKQRSIEWIKRVRPAKLPAPQLGPEDFDRLTAALDTPFDANPDFTMLPDEFQLDVMARYLDIRGWLEANQPAVKFSQGLIAREVPPSDTAKSRFMWAANIINDVTRVFDLLDAGGLTGIEAQAVREIYPDFAMAIMIQYLRTTIDYLYDEKKPTLSSWQLIGLSALAGVPITSFEDVAMWQSGFEEPAGGPAPQNSDVKFAAFNLTDTQKIEAKS